MGLRGSFIIMTCYFFEGDEDEVTDPSNGSDSSGVPFYAPVIVVLSLGSFMCVSCLKRWWTLHISHCVTSYHSCLIIFIIPFGEKSLMHIYSLGLADYKLVFFILWPRKTDVRSKQVTLYMFCHSKQVTW